MIVSQHKIDDEVLNYIESTRHLLTPDLSSYATGRLRAWVGMEAPLSNNRSFLPAPYGIDSPLYQWMIWFCETNLDFSPDVGLLHVGGADCSDPDEEAEDGLGGECGIKMHRDAAYADFKAVGINLAGEAVFGYRGIYPHLDRWSPAHEQVPDAPLERVVMKPGTCVVFNCKNPHFAQVGPNRWCLNAWRISEKRRKEFEQR